MCAVAVTLRRDVRDGGATREVDATITFSSSYATAGDTLKLGSLKLNRIKKAFVLSDKGTAAHGVQVILAGTDTAPKLKLVVGAIGSAAEVASTTNCSAIAVKMRFLGY